MLAALGAVGNAEHDGLALAAFAGSSLVSDEDFKGVSVIAHRESMRRLLFLVVVAVH
jgi:hypothetical protein